MPDDSADKTERLAIDQACRVGQVETDPNWMPSVLTRHRSIEAEPLPRNIDGRIRYTGRVEATMRAASPDLAAGFAMRDFAEADRALTHLRVRVREQV